MTNCKSDTFDMPLSSILCATRIIFNWEAVEYSHFSDWFGISREQKVIDLSKWIRFSGHTNTHKIQHDQVLNQNRFY